MIPKRIPAKNNPGLFRFCPAACAAPSYGDHRIAMSFLVAGFSAQGDTVLADAECINTSYPGFERDLAQFL